MMGGTCAAADQSVTTQSGFTYVGLPYHFVLEDDPSTLRLWFLSVDLGREGSEFVDVIDDIHGICEGLALTIVNENEWGADHIVIYMSDRLIEFGETVPEATQYIVGYSTDGATCTEELH